MPKATDAEIPREPPGGSAVKTDEKAPTPNAAPQLQAPGDAPPAGERPPVPDPATMTHLHEKLPDDLPRANTEPSGPTPGTGPNDPTQATDPAAAKPGTSGVD